MRLRRMMRPPPVMPPRRVMPPLPMKLPRLEGRGLLRPHRRTLRRRQPPLGGRRGGCERRVPVRWPFFWQRRFRVC